MRKTEKAYSAKRHAPLPYCFDCGHEEHGDPCGERHSSTQPDRCDCRTTFSESARKWGALEIELEKRRADRTLQEQSND